jgi:CRISPR/Cas system-associated protein Cas10 (large subunit of type III CRISPR-Cas system)
LAAPRAAPELFIVNLSKRLKLLNYVSLRNFLERRIAAKTPGKWGDEAKKIEAANYFYGLFIRILGSRAVTGPNDCMY